MKFKLILKTFIIIWLLGAINNSAYSWTWPTVSNYITSDFGPRDIGYWDFHEGIDIRASVGTDVYAAEGGTVDFSGTYPNGIIAIHIRHPNGMQSRYLHLSRCLVNVGNLVIEGQLIGESGTSGNVDPHLDFRFSPPSYPHPLRYLPYNNTFDPTVNRFENLTDGQEIPRVPGVIDVRINVLTTIDKDLNSFELQCDGNRIEYISYDPQTNCNSNTCDPHGVGNDTFVISWDTTAVEDGTHILTGIATDAGDRVGRRTITIVIGTPPATDTTPPTISITNPSENQVINTSNVVISGSVRDLGVNASGIRTASLSVGGRVYTLSGGNFNISVSLTDGNQTAIVEAEDNAGNRSSQERHFVVDTKLPKTEISASITNQKKTITIKKTTIIYTDCQGNEKRRETIESRSETVEKGKASFTWKGEDNITPSHMLKFSYRLLPSSFGGFGYSTSFKYEELSAGNYVFEVKAMDVAKNIENPPCKIALR